MASSGFTQVLSTMLAPSTSNPTGAHIHPGRNGTTGFSDCLHCDPRLQPLQFRAEKPRVPARLTLQFDTLWNLGFTTTHMVQCEGQVLGWEPRSHTDLSIWRYCSMSGKRHRSLGKRKHLIGSSLTAGDHCGRKQTGKHWSSSWEQCVLISRQQADRD